MLLGYALHAIFLNLDTAGVGVGVGVAATDATTTTTTKRRATSITIARTSGEAASTLSPCRQRRSIASPLDSPPCTTTTATTTTAT